MWCVHCSREGKRRRGIVLARERAAHSLAPRRRGPCKALNGIPGLRPFGTFLPKGSYESELSTPLSTKKHRSYAAMPFHFAVSEGFEPPVRSPAHLFSKIGVLRYCSRYYFNLPALEQPSVAQHCFLSVANIERCSEGTKRKRKRGIIAPLIIKINCTRIRRTRTFPF